MRTWNYYEVIYQGTTRLETLSKQEAESYARSLWSRDAQQGTAPTIDEHSRSGK